MLYGVIDIGSNTIRLVVYKVEEGKIIPIFNKKKLVGLASYIDSNNNLTKEGQDKALSSLKDFEDMISLIKVDEIFIFATAPLRNISNAQQALKYINDNIIFSIHVLTGKEEAEFDYYGAIQSVQTPSGLMVDIGGGSTELVFFKNNKVIASHSIPVGSLLLYTRYVDNLFPTIEEIATIQEQIQYFLNRVRLPHEEVSLDLMCGVGGTARAMSKFMKNKASYNREAETYPTHELETMLDLAKDDQKRLMKSIIKVCPDRIHTFTIGLTILNEIANFFNNKNVITSDYGVREGYLYHILEERGEL